MVEKKNNGLFYVLCPVKHFEMLFNGNYVTANQIGIRSYTKYNNKIVTFCFHIFKKSDV